MTTGMRIRAFSAPVKPMQLMQLNEYKDKKICKEDLRLFVDKYKKESKILNFLRGLPPEIKIIQNIVDRYQSFVCRRTPISESDKDLLANMICLNKEHREENSNKSTRLRDTIIDRMVTFFELEKEIEYQYISLHDYI